jgi:uncharacterized protein with ParB-like and HNH nuclease domain
MIQNTANKSLSELFSADNSVTYHIPKYQREYVWTKGNWELFFDDIEESSGVLILEKDVLSKLISLYTFILLI